MQSVVATCRSNHTTPRHITSPIKPAQPNPTPPLNPPPSIHPAKTKKKTQPPKPTPSPPSPPSTPDCPCQARVYPSLTPRPRLQKKKTPPVSQIQRRESTRKMDILNADFIFVGWLVGSNDNTPVYERTWTRTCDKGGTQQHRQIATPASDPRTSFVLDVGGECIV
jgi:hypothetical protein